MNFKLGCKGTGFVLKFEKKPLLLFKILSISFIHKVLFDNELGE